MVRQLSAFLFISGGCLISLPRVFVFKANMIDSIIREITPFELPFFLFFWRRYLVMCLMKARRSMCARADQEGRAKHMRSICERQASRTCLALPLASGPQQLQARGVFLQPRIVQRGYCRPLMHLRSRRLLSLGVSSSRHLVVCITATSQSQRWRAEPRPLCAWTWARTFFRRRPAVDAKRRRRSEALAGRLAPKRAGRTVPRQGRPAGRLARSRSRLVRAVRASLGAAGCGGSAGELAPGLARTAAGAGSDVTWRLLPYSAAPLLPPHCAPPALPRNPLLVLGYSRRPCARLAQATAL